MHRVEKRKHLSQLVQRIGWNALGVAILIKPFQALVREAANFQWPTVNCSLTLVKGKVLLHAIHPTRGSILLRSGVAAEARFFKKVFGIYA